MNRFLFALALAALLQADDLKPNPSAYLMNQASGTSMNPRVLAHADADAGIGSWRLMFMGQAFLVDTQQSGPRGGDKLYAPNWFMGFGRACAGRGQLACSRRMLSLDPATITDRRYPGAVPDRRDRLRQAAGRRAASARFHHGPGGRLRAAAGRKDDAAVLLRAGRRSGAGTGRVSASRFGVRTAAGHACASLAGFDPYRQRTWSRRAVERKWCAWRPAASTAPSRTRIAGTSIAGPMNSWSGRVSSCSVDRTGWPRSR